MTLTLVRSSTFVLVMLWAAAVHAESSSQEISFGATSTSRETLSLARHATLTFISKKLKKEDFKPVEDKEVLGKIRWLELMRCNYAGHDPEQFRYYGPMAPDFLASFEHDGFLNSGDATEPIAIAAQALKQVSGNVMKVLGQGTEFRVRARKMGMVVFSFGLFLD